MADFVSIDFLCRLFDSTSLVDSVHNTRMAKKFSPYRIQKSAPLLTFTFVYRKVSFLFAEASLGFFFLLHCACVYLPLNGLDSYKMPSKRSLCLWKLCATAVECVCCIVATITLRNSCIQTKRKWAESDTGEICDTRRFPLSHKMELEWAKECNHWKEWHRQQIKDNNNNPN